MCIQEACGERISDARMWKVLREIVPAFPEGGGFKVSSLDSSGGVHVGRVGGAIRIMPLCMSYNFYVTRCAGPSFVH